VISLKKFEAFAGQFDMAHPAGFGRADQQRSAVAVEVGDMHPGKLAISGAAQQRIAHDHAQGLRAGVDQPLAFIAVEIADPRGIHLTERGDATPCIIRGRPALAPRMVEGGFQHCQHAVRGGAATALSFGIVRGLAHLLSFPRPVAEPWGCRGDVHVPLTKPHPG
jgi:hypothetical protein